MQSKQSSTPYMNAIRNGEVYPPFAEVRTLVMQRDERRKALLPFRVRFMMEGALLAAFVIASFMLAQRVPEVSVANVPSTAEALRSIIAPPVSGTQTTIKDRRAIVASSTVQEVNSDQVVAASTIPAVPVDAITEAKIAQVTVDSTITVTAATHAIAPIAVMNTSLDDGRTQWMAYATGGYILSGAASPIGGMTQSLAGSIGIRYGLNDASSIALEARRNVFHVNRNVRSTAFRDTTLTLNGHTYLNTIGNPSTTVTETSNIIASLDAAYRFELWPSGRLTPFAEAFIGGSRVGAISSESVGLRYRLDGQFLLDLSARADQLFSPKASPERAFGLETTVGFGW